MARAIHIVAAGLVLTAVLATRQEDVNTTEGAPVDVSQNSAPGKLSYLRWVVDSLTGSPHRVAKCESSGMWSCSLKAAKTMTPIFVIGGQCPGSKCSGSEQAVLYAMPEKQSTMDEVRIYWTKNDNASDADSLGCKVGTRSMNACGTYGNEPSGMVSNSYKDITQEFRLVERDGQQRFKYMQDDVELFLVALIVEQIDWGMFTPNGFTGKLVYQKDAAQLFTRQVTAADGKLQFQGEESSDESGIVAFG